MFLQHTFTDPSYRQDDRDGMNVMVQSSLASLNNEEGNSSAC